VHALVEIHTISTDVVDIIPTKPSSYNVHKKRNGRIGPFILSLFGDVIQLDTNTAHVRTWTGLVKTSQDKRRHEKTKQDKTKQAKMKQDGKTGDSIKTKTKARQCNKSQDNTVDDWLPVRKTSRHRGILAYY
jgi:hypothetical protein